MDDVYLKPNVVFEPLVGRWYAWPHLISPATAAMNIRGRHLKIMDSYISNPELHLEALKSPAMRGGPFMDFGGFSKTAEIEKLKNKTLCEQKILLELADSISSIDEMLSSDAKGFSLEGIYPKIPAPLKGYVELFYDRNNNAGFRFFEALLYDSVFYNEDLQSLALWVTENDERPFCLSTPRLEDNTVLHLNIPFRHAGIDELAKMRRKSNSLHYIQDVLGIHSDQMNLFSTFFTASEPQKYKNYSGDKIRMRYFGHACILIETADISVLVDPLVSYYGYSSNVEHFSDADLPESIDYALITHNHQDHILLETMLPLRHRVKNLIVPSSRSGRLEDPDLKLMLERIGFGNITSIHEMQTVNLNDVKITAIPFTGEHCDLNILSKSGYLVEICNFKLLFLADSRIVEAELYRHVHRKIGDIDVLFMGMECEGAPLSWLYGPLFTNVLKKEHDISRRLSGSDYDKGWPIIDIFHPKEVYVYAMGQEPWVEFITSVKYTDDSNPIVQSNKLIKECLRRGIAAERLYGEKELLYNKKDLIKI